MSLSDNDRPHVWAVGAGTESPLSPALKARVQVLAHQLLSDAMDPSLADDRFDGSFPSGSTFRAAIGMLGDSCVGILGGSITDGKLQLHGLIAPMTAPLSAPTAVDSDSPPTALQNSSNKAEIQRLQDLLNALASSLNDPAIEAIELWAHPETPWHYAVADSNGFAPLRALHQLRCALPVSPDPEARTPLIPVTTRAFDPDRDIKALVEVNNRAFVDHPDQGRMTIEGFGQSMKEPWFSAEGLRVFDDPDLPGTLAGFCWTKIHRGRGSEPDLGEIYVIGVDPRHHGKGLGGPMTAAGLDWLTDQGLTNGMLYVEATNEPALRTYRRLGFVRHRTDRAWIRSAGQGKSL